VVVTGVVVVGVTGFGVVVTGVVVGTFTEPRIIFTVSEGAQPKLVRVTPAASTYKFIMQFGRLESVHTRSPLGSVA
jgi:hypothetical protein